VATQLKMLVGADGEKAASSNVNSPRNVVPGKYIFKFKILN